MPTIIKLVGGANRIQNKGQQSDPNICVLNPHAIQITLDKDRTYVRYLFISSLMQCLLNAKHCAEYFSENYVSFRELRKLMVEAPGVRLRLPGLGMGRRPRSLWGKSPLPRAQSEGSCLVERHRTMHYILTVPPPGLTDSSSQRMKIIRHLQQWCQAGGHALGPGNNSTLSSCHHCNKVSGSHSRGSQSCVCPHACTCTHTIL